MDIKVYDYQGNLRDLAYIKGKYGPFKIKAADDSGYPQFKVSALYERSDGQSLLDDLLIKDDDKEPHVSNALIVLVKDENGVPVFNQRVAWYWPDADPDPFCGPVGGVLPEMTPNICVSGQTSGSGDVGFGMGKGAYYFPPHIGPHATWVYGTQTRSDVILGLGMVGGTNHDHFDVEFTEVEEEVPPPEPPDDKWQELYSKLDRIIELLEAKLEARNK